MNLRRNELSHFSDLLAWLAKDDAKRVYDSASVKTSTERYGLDEQFWEIATRWNVSGNEEKDNAKLSSLLSEEFFLVFGDNEVCRISRSSFIKHWRDMFVPSRDDVIVIPSSEEWCLFYCHDDEFEFGRKKASTGRNKKA